jgi:hypothetical protein
VKTAKKLNVSEIKIYSLNIKESAKKLSSKGDKLIKAFAKSGDKIQNLIPA